MLPVDFQERNALYGKPEGWTDEQCMTLPVWRGIDADGTPFCISVWQPSKEDLDALIAGRGLVLKLVCPVQIPIAMWTLDENGEVN